MEALSHEVSSEFMQDNGRLIFLTDKIKYSIDNF